MSQTFQGKKTCTTITVLSHPYSFIYAYQAPHHSYLCADAVASWPVYLPYTHCWPGRPARREGWPSHIVYLAINNIGD